MTNINSDLKITPVILSGGSGLRLWPLSRSSLPKQYLNLDERNYSSLLQNTYLRLKGLEFLNHPIIISSENQRFLAAEQLREINVNPDSIILEPVGRNTAPAITLASLKASHNNADPILLVLSSDHKIEDEENFREVIKDSLIHARNGRIVTFGIAPTSPETGYGYIETYNLLTDENKSSHIKKFIEKPSHEIAKNLIKDKHFYWNSGIFLFKASVFLKEIKKFEPKIFEICDKSLKEGSEDLDFFRLGNEIFKQCPNTSIDIAVMEKTTLGTIVAFNSGWSDLGSWKSIWENSKKDEKGNYTRGKVFSEGARNCFFRSEERLVVGIDINDLIIIETSDAILVSHINSAQKVKNIPEKLNKLHLTEGNQSKKSFRPWGNFVIIGKEKSWQVKRLEIKPNASISLQMHKHRAEHWIVVKGEAIVEIDKKTFSLKKNESTYIPIGSKHRLSNPGNKSLILIEVQNGDYLGEDDIVRFEDKYGRKS